MSSKPLKSPEGGLVFFILGSEAPLRGVWGAVLDSL
jgi:hypothetical protein